MLLAVAYLRREGLEAPEYFALVLLSASGMLMMTTANDLIVVFLALEMLSIPLYVLAAFDRRRLGSQEAGLKYFVLGAFSSASSSTASRSPTAPPAPPRSPASRSSSPRTRCSSRARCSSGLGLLLVGLGFKVAAVPFHMWTPDVYQGAPTPVTAFMAAATKAAAFAALLRLFTIAFPQYRDDWRPIVWVLAVLSLLVGSIAAVVQTDVKRILAYSSIAHAGYILMGVYAATPRGREAAVLYLFVYSFMTIGAFAVLTIATQTGDDQHSLDDYRGLALRRPVLGGLLIFFVLAQAGIPLTGGFIGKLEVFGRSPRPKEYVMLVIGVLSAVIASFFYLRIAFTLVTAPEDDDRGRGDARGCPRRIDGWSGIVLFVTAAHRPRRRPRPRLLHPLRPRRHLLL